MGEAKLPSLQWYSRISTVPVADKQTLELVEEFKEGSFGAVGMNEEASHSFGVGNPKIALGALFEGNFAGLLPHFAGFRDLQTPDREI